MTGRRVAACVAVALVLAGCSAEPVPDRTPHSTVEQPGAEVPADRDREAVLAALRELDLCAALGAGTPEVTTSTPFTCESDLVRVRVAELDFAQRVALPVRDLGGAKAYVSAHCQISLPVSFRLALTFDPRGACGPAQELVADTAAAIADPELVRRDPVWDACGALAAALGDRVAVTEGSPQACSDEAGEIGFELKYATPRQDGRTSESVEGVTVWTLAEDESCTSEWAIGNAPEYAITGDQLVASVRARECDPVAETVADLVPVLKEPPPDTDPQRPLLYGPDEPDSPRAGACAYLEDDHCEPFAEVPVPSTEIVQAAEADADVTCAVARAAVTTHFGSAMRPVTVPDGKCVFVEPDWSVRVEVNLWSDPADVITDVHSDLREIDLASHPGYLRTGPDGLEYAIALSAKVDQPGTLKLLVTPGPLGGDRLAPAAQDKAEAVLTDVLGTHFG